jgi:hypothetical protein
MFYESLAFNEGGNDGFWRFQLRDKYGRWIKMGGSAMFEFRKPNDKNVYKAKGTFQGNIRRGASIIRVGEGEQLPPGDYEVDSRYIESIKAIINTTSAKPEIVDAPKSVNPDVEKQATEREMVAATVKDLEAGDIVQQSTEEALYGQINSVEHGDTESKINVTWSDGSNYDMTLPGEQKIKVWGVEPEGETVDAPSVVKREPSMWDGVPFGSDEIQDSGNTNYAINEPNPPEVAYHVAPRSAREDILNNGLDPKDETWNTGAGADGTYRDEHLWMEDDDGNEFAYEYRPVGVYMFPTLERAQEYAGGKDADIYEIDTAINDREIIRDPSSAVNWDFLEEHEKAYVTRYVDPSALKIVGESETVDAPNVEEAPEVPEATRVIDNPMVAAEVNAALAEKVGVLPTSIQAAMEFKQHAARVILDKMLASGITVEQLIGASKSDGARPMKYDYTDPESKLDFKTVVNKLPETLNIVGSTVVSPEVILNPGFDDNTVMGAGSKINIMKSDDYYGVSLFSIEAPKDFVNMEGKTLKEVQTLAKEHPALRGFHGDFTVVGTAESKRMFTESLTSKLVQNWANTSNDKNPESLAIQESAKTLFGLTDVAPWDMDDDVKGAVQANLDEHGDVFQMFLKAQYDATQEFFAEEGIKEFVLYRGFTSKFKVDTGYTDTVLRPLSSFSTKKTQAEEFALPGGFDFGYLVEMTVPVKDILSVPGLGLGSYTEKEVVVLGGKRSAFIEML